MGTYTGLEVRYPFFPRKTACKTGRMFRAPQLTALTSERPGLAPRIEYRRLWLRGLLHVTYARPQHAGGRRETDRARPAVAATTAGYDHYSVQPAEKTDGLLGHGALCRPCIVLLAKSTKGAPWARRRQADQRSSSLKRTAPLSVPALAMIAARPDLLRAGLNQELQREQAIVIHHTLHLCSHPLLLSLCLL